MIDSAETKRIKARNLRYKKSIVKNINLATIKSNLFDIYEECESVKWYVDEENTLLNA